MLTAGGGLAPAAADPGSFPLFATPAGAAPGPLPLTSTAIKAANRIRPSFATDGETMEAGSTAILFRKFPRSSSPSTRDGMAVAPSGRSPPRDDIDGFLFTNPPNNPVFLDCLS